MTQIVVVGGGPPAVQTGRAGRAVAGSCQDRPVGPVGHAPVALEAHAGRAAAPRAAGWTLTAGTLSNPIHNEKRSLGDPYHPGYPRRPCRREGEVGFT